MGFFRVFLHKNMFNTLGADLYMPVRTFAGMSQETLVSQLDTAIALSIWISNDCVVESSAILFFSITPVSNHFPLSLLCTTTLSPVSN